MAQKTHITCYYKNLSTHGFKKINIDRHIISGVEDRGLIKTV